MNLRTIAIGLVLLGQISCSDEDFDVNSFRDNKSITTLNGTWKVISFEDFATEKVEFKNQENSWGHDIIVTFDDTQDPNWFSGRNTTNSVFGEFHYVGSRQFRLERLGTTFAGQPEWADKFSRAVLDGDVNFIVNEIRLRIYYDDKTKSVTLTME